MKQCSKGHELTQTNTFRDGPWLRCRVCKNAYNARWMRRKRAEYRAHAENSSAE